MKLVGNHNGCSYISMFIFSRQMEALGIQELDIYYPKSKRMSNYNDWIENALKQALEQKKLVALGEIGLDFSK